MVQKVMPQAIMDELGSDSFDGYEVELKGTKYTVHEKLGEPSLAGVTRRCTDDMGIEFAMKFTTHGSYAKSYLDEVSKVRRLRNCANIARLEAWGESLITLPSGRSEYFVILVSEFVRGDSLKRYLASNTVGPSFLTRFVDGVCEALFAFKSFGLYHNDLHDRNIMISEPDLATLDSDSKIVKLIDTGNVSSISEPVKPLMTDHACLVSCLIQILRRIEDSEHLLRKRERQYLESVRTILRSMVEEDVQMRLSDPRRIREEFRRAWQQAQVQISIDAETPPQLNNPFEYIQAEHIVSDRLLEALFSNKCPWYEKVRGPDPVNIDGPRGCGKSTMFRMLRLKTLLHTRKNEDILALKEIGFYVSCTADIGARFAFVTPDTAKRLSREIVHFFNLVVLSEVIETLVEMSMMPGLMEAAGWTPEIERDFHGYLLGMLNMNKDQNSQLNGTSRLEHLEQVIEKEKFNTHQHVLSEKTLEHASPASLLNDVTSFLINRVSFFSGKRILFLLDDYSLHRVPDYVQRVLNHVIWTQVPNYVFKISSEVGGITALAPIGGTADMSREFVEVNVGVEYVSLTESAHGEEFIADVLDRRLQLSRYTATISDILGETKYPNDLPLGQALRAEAIGELKGTPVYYHGVSCIASLCSGDIAITLDIVRHIFQNAGISPAGATKISPSKQHEAIQDFSRGLYSKVGEYVPFGKEMKRILYSFGWMSRYAVSDLKQVTKGGDRLEPYQYLRIEVDDDPNQRNLPEIQTNILHELLRRAIFIELPRGRSVTGSLTRRFQLRRAYCPAFKMPLAHNRPMIIHTWERFHLFLDSPNVVCEDYLKNVLGKKQIVIGEDLEQIPMIKLVEEAERAY